MAKDLLLEIGMEEVPSAFIRPATEQLADRLGKWLDETRIGYASVKTYATPRRFAVWVKEMEEQQRDESVEAKGPSRKIALDDQGAWSKAALGFARSQGVNPEDLYFKELQGVDYVHATRHHQGVETAALLGEGLMQVIQTMTFPKNMRWGSREMKFVRPIRWLVALFGREVIDLSVAGVTAGRVTRGHRFLGQSVEITSPADYEAALADQHVIADVDKRKELMMKQLTELAADKGWVIPVKEDLLEEVLFLVETPTVLFGSFDPGFLTIPKEVLITSMREHQRYFPVLDASENLLPHFVTVRNGNKEHLDTVARGNEKVLRARLSDARFFYEEDQEMPIDSALQKLETVVFQEELGTVGDKVRRITAIAAALASRIGVEVAKTAEIVRAASICKFDLVTQMVYEFPELQGIMGEDYARKAGESGEVAKAVNEHYQPRHAGDAVPSTVVGAVVSLADKIDTIVGCFSIGIVPTGSQDPYALRRQASGIVQILLEHRLPLGVGDLFEVSLDVLKTANLLKREEGDIRNTLYDFFGLRMKNLLSERGIRYDIVDAVLAVGFDSVAGAVARADELSISVRKPGFKAAVESFNRAVNLAAKADSAEVVPDEFTEPSERELFEAVIRMQHAYQVHLDKNEAGAALALLRQLEAPITAFFEAVMVMAEDPDVRRNRLGLLSIVALMVRSFADFSKLVW
ncbi:glycine--tRNA ligase subunit beta [Gorillibacterium timonense]|uniref:glycine--tRNA ligase subunit beta n=1 Tax=Gorillibacterium timonense TaxID=1689269 RepID=UPI00071DE725|nr:glycine--tRNA ligase subunit beta [Gorillibacterium timonense]